MNNLFKFLALVFLMAVCCHISRDENSGREYSDVITREHSDENYLSQFSFKFTGHTPQSEYSANGQNQLPEIRIKKPIFGQEGVVHAIEQIFRSSFSQYAAISENLLVEHRKTNLIFPFHYFW